MQKTTSYQGITKFYFYQILKDIIRIGNLRRSDGKILDFGCGKGKLKLLLKKSNVVGYDLIKTYSDIDNWEKVEFEYFIANQVFYSMTSNDLEKLLIKIRDINPNTKLIVGTSRVGILNKLGMILFNKRDAHKALKLLPEDEHNIIKKFCQLKEKKNVFFLSDVYYYKFK